jgi:hypothetical protein
MAENTFIPFFDQFPRPSGEPSASKNEFAPVASPAPAGSAPKHGGVSHSHAEARRPVVKLQKEGDKIKTIRIECVCGEIIELDCVY